MKTKTKAMKMRSILARIQMVLAVAISKGNYQTAYWKAVRLENLLFTIAARTRDPATAGFLNRARNVCGNLAFELSEGEEPWYLHEVEDHLPLVREALSYTQKVETSY